MRHEQLLKELRAVTYGHGAFGESESYQPCSLQLRAAAAIEEEMKRVEEELKKAALFALYNRGCPPTKDQWWNFIYAALSISSPSDIEDK